MDKFIDDFFEKREKSYVKEFAFLNEYNNFSKQLYCICEGTEDKICYLPKIKCILKQDFKIYDVGGKDNVIEIFNRCEYQGYDLNKIMFIVDRDFDEPLNNNKIYELPVYSIENLYATPEVLKDFIESTVGVSNNSVVDRILENYLLREQEFNFIIQDLNIFLFYTKKIFDSLSNEENIYLSYKNISLPSIDDDEVKKCIKITLLKVEAADSFEDIKKTYNFIKEDIEKMRVTEFAIINAREKYKGKYQFYLFITYIKEQIRDLNLGKSKAKDRILADKNYGCDIELKDNTLFNILSNYVQLPICFENYVKKFIYDESRIKIVS